MTGSGVLPIIRDSHASAEGCVRERRTRITHLRELEAESLAIFREVVAECERPVLLYSIGKDSSVLLHLAKKAFAPAPLPFPLLHVDTTFKFREMIAFRDQLGGGLDLRVKINHAGLAAGANPFDWSSDRYTKVMKTEALLSALREGRFDAAFGGARRDEEKSRAKERVLSFRDRHGQWDPKAQRPELFGLYNGLVERGESLRVFPLSNWTELDVWQYIWLEQIPVVPLYFAARRPVVERDGALLMVDDERFRLRPTEAPRLERVRFRTLGCYPLTGAIRSSAQTVPDIVREMIESTTSERQGRLIDGSGRASMEAKKREGYF